MWTSETKIYLCPYETACVGDYNSEAYSVEWTTTGDIWRDNLGVPPNCADSNIPVEFCTAGVADASKGATWGNPAQYGWTYGKSGTKCNTGDGYTGVACATCRTDDGPDGLGYAFTGSGCVKCVPFAENAGGAMFSFIVLILYAIYDLAGRIAHCRTKAMAADSKTLSWLMKKKKILTRTRVCVCQLMIMVGFAQALCTLNANLKVDFPEEFVELSASLSFLNLDVVNIISSLCIIKGSFYLTLQFQFWVPTLLSLIAMLDYCRSRKMDADEEDAGVFHIKFLIMTFFSLYPQSARVFLGFLLCVNVDGKWYLGNDYREECYDDKWSSYAALAIPGIIVYVVGTPAFFLSVLYYMNKEGILHTAANSDKFAFLFINYKPDFWFFAIYDLLVKCTLCAIIMFIEKGSATQVAVTLFLAIIFCFVAMTTAPHKNLDLNANAALTTSSMVLTMFTALLIKVKIYEIDGWSQGVLNGFVMGVNFITMFLFVYRFVRVQGNFLCEQYFPKQCQDCFLAFNRFMGWKPPPDEAPPDAKGGDDEGTMLLATGAGKKPSDFWQSTFKAVS